MRRKNSENLKLMRVTSEQREYVEREEEEQQARLQYFDY
jgi:hypothetical protein